jgi:hypothetical protein
MGRRYSQAFNAWIRTHHFEAMPKATRSVALDLNENLSEIEAWRTTLTEKERRRLVHPLSNVRRWRKATTPKSDGRTENAVAAARAALNRFVACVEALPPEKAEPLWREVYERAGKEFI